VFEFDPARSEANRAKHGIDFVEAQALWDDETRVVAPALSAGEQRWMMVGRIEDKLWSAIFTIRDEGIRIISVRRSRPKEVAYYEAQDD
jgi:uncharacterized DUF497 family protein